MAYPLHGKSCSVTVDGVTANKVAELGEWSIEASIDMAEDSQFGDNWKTFIPGMAEWSGSMSGAFDPTDTYQKEVHDLLVAATPGTALADARFNLDTGDYYSGTIYITGVSITAGIGDKVMIEITFQGSGALSLTA